MTLRVLAAALFTTTCLLPCTGTSSEGMKAPGDINAWIKAAQPLNDSSVFYYGPAYDEFIPFKAANPHYINEFRYARDYDLLSVNRPDLMPVAFSQMTLQGFKLRDSNKDPQSVLQADYDGKSQAPTVTWKCDRERWHQYLAVVFLDSWSDKTTGNEQLGIYHNDQKIGTIRFGNRGRLPHAYPYAWKYADETGNVPMPNVFDSTGPFEWHRYGYIFKKKQDINEGDTIRLVAETAGHYQLTDLVCMSRPDILPLTQQEIAYPEVRVWTSEEKPNRLQFAWVTRLPSRGGVLYSKDRKALDAGQAQWLGETRYADNHQAFSDLALNLGETLYYRIVAESNDGQRAATGVLSYTPPASSPDPRTLWKVQFGLFRPSHGGL